jgi:hypothetical protein
MICKILVVKIPNPCTVIESEVLSAQSDLRASVD